MIGGVSCSRPSWRCPKSYVLVRWLTPAVVIWMCAPANGHKRTGYGWVVLFTLMTILRNLLVSDRAILAQRGSFRALSERFCLLWPVHPEGVHACASPRAPRFTLIRLSGLTSGGRQMMRGAIAPVSRIFVVPRFVRKEHLGSGGR